MSEARAPHEAVFLAYLRAAFRVIADSTTPEEAAAAFCSDTLAGLCSALAFVFALSEHDPEKVAATVAGAISSIASDIERELPGLILTARRKLPEAMRALADLFRARSFKFNLN
jgi:hypothetical protein